MKFRINYTKVIQQADEISGYAERLAAQIRQLQQLEQDCRSVWKGKAAAAFLAKLSVQENELRRAYSRMKNLSATIRYCAERIQREDEAEAKRLQSLQGTGGGSGSSW